MTTITEDTTDFLPEIGEYVVPAGTVFTVSSENRLSMVSFKNEDGSKTYVFTETENLD